MGENSKIEWTHHTFNPWRGCVEVAPECGNCYAKTLSGRNPAALGVWGGETEGGVRVLGTDAYWQQPRKWNREAAAAGERRRVFCASLADVFEDWQGPIVNAKGCGVYLCIGCGQLLDGALPTVQGAVGPYCTRCEKYSGSATLADVRRQLFALIDATPDLDWLLLTKRPQNVLRMWPLTPGIPSTCVTTAGDFQWERPTQLMYRPNVWLVTSAGSQPTADVMIPELLKCRDLVPVLGVSAEPLLGPVDLVPFIGFLPLPHATRKYLYERTDVPYLDWVIVGGESGHHARPMHPQWASDIRDQCTRANVAFFFKQWGEWIDSSSTVCLDLSLVGAESIGDERCRWLSESGEIKPIGVGKMRDGDACMIHLGKKLAGRLLDGALHDAFPNVTTLEDAKRE